MTEEQFTETINSLTPEEKKEVFDIMEASRQKMIEAQNEWNAVLIYLTTKFKKNGTGRTSTNNNTAMESVVHDPNQSTIPFSGGEETNFETHGTQQPTIPNQTRPEHDHETNPRTLRKRTSS